MLPILTIVEIVFWIAIGLHFLGLHFTYQPKIIGFCALVIGLFMLFGVG